MFAGCIEKNSNLVGDQLRKMLASGLADIPFDDAASWQDQGITLVQQRRWNTLQSKNEQGVIHHHESGVIIIGWLRIDNRLELRDQLQASEPILCESDTGLVLAAYLAWGNQLCQKLAGDFVFVIYDSRTRCCLLVRDHMGIRPLYYYWDGETFVFATSIAIISRLQGLSLSLSDEWMARYLADCSQDWELCVYELIKKVPPASYISFENKVSAPNIYFEFEQEAGLRLKSDQEYVDAYREVLDEAVRCRIESDYPIGSESSGGLDSSTVTALAAEHMQFPSRDLHTFGFANHEQEPECILAVSQQSAMRSTNLVTGTGLRVTGFFQTWNQFYASNGTPVEHPNGYSHTPFYEMANHWGIRTLLSGFGGDEFATNPGTQSLNEFWLNRQYSYWFSRFNGNPIARTVRAVKWLNSYYRYDNQFSTALILENVARKLWQARILTDKACEQFDIEKRFMLQAKYDSHCNSVNEFILSDRWSPQMTARLENCTLMAALYGLEYRWPLLDVRLLKLYLSMPPEQKLGPSGVSRYIHKRAISSSIPALVTWKGKSMGNFVKTEAGFSQPVEIEQPRKAMLHFDDLHSNLKPLIDESRLADLLLNSKQNPGSAVASTYKRTLNQLNDLQRWLSYNSNLVG